VRGVIQTTADAGSIARRNRHRAMARTGAASANHVNGATTNIPSVGSATYRSAGQFSGSQAGADTRTASHGAVRYGNTQLRRGGANAYVKVSGSRKRGLRNSWGKVIT